MKKTNYTEKNDTELMELLAAAREDLRVHRFAAAGARTKDSNIAKKTRANIARILTLMGARKSGQVTLPTA